LFQLNLYNKAHKRLCVKLADSLEFTVIQAEVSQGMELYTVCHVNGNVQH